MWRPVAGVLLLTMCVLGVGGVVGGAEFPGGWTTAKILILTGLTVGITISLTLLADPPTKPRDQTEPPEWPRNRIFRTILASLVALVAVGLIGGSYVTDALQHCTSVEAEATITINSTNATTSTNDTTDDGLSTTNSCGPWPAVALTPFAVAIGVLLLPDVTTLAFGDFLSVEFKEIKKKTDQTAKKAEEAVSSITMLHESLDVAVAQFQSSHQELQSQLNSTQSQSVEQSQVVQTISADIFEKLESLMGANARRVDLERLWDLVGERSLWDDEATFDQAVRKIRRWRTGVPPTIAELGDFYEAAAPARDKLLAQESVGLDKAISELSPSTDPSELG